MRHDLSCETTFFGHCFLEDNAPSTREEETASIAFMRHEGGVSQCRDHCKVFLSLYLNFFSYDPPLAQSPQTVESSGPNTQKAENKGSVT